jgi:hypothetical protein
VAKAAAKQAHHKSADRTFIVFRRSPGGHFVWSESWSAFCVQKFDARPATAEEAELMKRILSRTETPDDRAKLRVLITRDAP